jgi:hypothetical protein
MIPVDVVTVQQHSITTTAPIPIAPAHTTPTSWSNTTSSSSAWITESLPPKWKTEWNELITALRNGDPLSLHCDGSVKDGNGAFAWIIATDTHTIVHHQGPVIGNPMTPFRAECFGATSVLHFIERTASINSIASNSKITLHTDCQAILPYVSHDPIEYKHNIPLRRDYDVSQQAHRTFTTLAAMAPGLTSGQYVKAHQEISPDSSWAAILNADCDAAAKNFRQTYDYSNHEPKFRSPFPSIQHKGSTITGKEIHTTRWAWRNRVYKEYLQERLSMTELEIASINWNAISAATYSITPTIKPFSVKLSIRWIATGTRCAKYGSLMDSCHLCDEPETHNHLIPMSPKTGRKEHLHQGTPRISGHH